MSLAARHESDQSRDSEHRSKRPPVAKIEQPPQNPRSDGCRRSKPSCRTYEDEEALYARGSECCDRVKYADKVRRSVAAQVLPRLIFGAILHTETPRFLFALRLKFRAVATRSMFIYLVD